MKILRSHSFGPAKSFAKRAKACETVIIFWVRGEVGIWEDKASSMIWGPKKVKGKETKESILDNHTRGDLE